MSVETRIIHLETRGNAEIIDITPRLRDIIDSAGINSGIINVSVPGSTGAITTMEYEPGQIADLKEMLEKLVPENEVYQHNIREGDSNGHSHLRASLIGCSQTIPFKDKELLLGTWQQVVFVDCDVRARHRELITTVIGE